MSGVPGEAGDVKEGLCEAENRVDHDNMAAPIVLPVAPALRVEELKDYELGEGGSSTFGSDEEGMSPGHGSDLDVGHADHPETEFVPPSDELRDRIIQQVEFYFSDANILKDKFLLKHVRRNKMGYVSIKLITSFKRLKSMTKDYRQVAFSLRQSDKLDVNEEGTKVRRKEPLPDYDETTPSRTIVTVNLPVEQPTIENVAELFSKCGEIALIRILRPGKPIPQDVKKHMNKHPEIGEKVCAVIEFELHESAKKACDSMNNTEDWRNGLRVVLLSAPKKEKKNDKTKNGKPDDGKSDGEKEGNEGKNKKKRKKRGSRVEVLSHGSESPCPSSGSEMDGADITPNNSRPSSANKQRRDSAGKAGTKGLSPHQDPNRLSPNTTPRSTPRSSPRSSPRGSPNLRRRGLPGRSPLADSHGDNTKISPRASPRESPEMQRKFRHESPGTDSGSSPSSPWVQRRLKAQQEISPLAGSPGASPRLGRRLPDGTLPAGGPPPRMADMTGVVRQPRGPDGTNGFYGGKGRGQVLPAAIEAAS